MTSVKSTQTKVKWVCKSAIVLVEIALQGRSLQFSNNIPRKKIQKVISNQVIYTCRRQGKPRGQRWKTPSSWLGKETRLSGSNKVGANCWKAVLFLWSGIPIFIKAICTVVKTENKKGYIKLFSKHHFFVILYNYDTLKAAVQIFGEKSFAVSWQSHEKDCTLHNESQIIRHSCLQWRFTWNILGIT